MCKLDKDKNRKSINTKLYRDIIESLLYLMASRSDIIFSLYMCARYQSNPEEFYLFIVKRILRYLISTLNINLWYSRYSSIDLIGYSDADFASYKLDKK